MRPDPDFQEFALDCIRLSNQEKSPRLRHRLLMLARGWMHAARDHAGGRSPGESNERIDTNSGEPWSEYDISDLTGEGRRWRKPPAFFAGDEDEVREKMKE